MALFSTCQQKMRSGIVASSPRYLFFVTVSKIGPPLWLGCTSSGLDTGIAEQRIRDFALAAKRVRFIAPAAIDSLPEPLATNLAGDMAPRQEAHGGAG